MFDKNLSVNKADIKNFSLYLPALDVHDHAHCVRSHTNPEEDKGLVKYFSWSDI